MPETVRDSNLVELLLFTASGPLKAHEIEERLPPGTNLQSALSELKADYADRSIELVETAAGWSIRTRPEYSSLCRDTLPKPPRLSKAAMETLATIAAFQPVTRSEIEKVRGVSLAKGTLDLLVWMGWVHPGERRKTPGNPLTFVTTEKMLADLNVPSLDALPGYREIKKDGLSDLANISISDMPV